MKQASLSSNAELWQVMWSPVPKGTFSAPTISYTAVPTNEKAPAVNAAPAYRPPGARGSKAPVTKVHEYELPSNQKKAASETETNSAPLSKNQKRKRAKAAAIAKAAENTTGDAKQAPVTSPQQAPVTSPQQAPATGSQQTPLYVVDLTGDPEKDKRIKNLTKKLQQIMKLKGDLAAGVKLQFNQLEKLKKEEEIVDELNNISLS
ncbi:EIF2A [Bugula neritina]|uniref:EIF2A n=1 Tax=Bugula neritina TaxID=10212 RepID=A0A7J7JIG6_BUGNE|nr:EIF2A [Bugula neritina]